MKAPSGLLAVTQCAVLTNGTATAMKTRMITSLIATITLLTRADSRMPTTSNVEMATITSIAGMLMIAPVARQTCSPAS